MSQITTATRTAPAELLSPEFMTRLDQLDLLSRKILHGKLKGERRSKKRGQSVEFADYRNYVLGDDLRFIDWNLYARLDRLFLRLFTEEEDQAVSVLLDVSASMDFGRPDKLTYGKQLAAALGYIGLINYNRVSVMSFGRGLIDELTNLRGRRPVSQMLQFLAAQSPRRAAAGSLADTTRQFAIKHRQKGIVILISDFLDKGDLAAAMRYLTGDRYDAYLLQLLSPQEIDPVAAGLTGDLQLQDIEDNELTEVSISNALLKRYKANLQRFCDHLRQLALRRDIAHMVTDTSVPFDRLVLRYLRERNLLG